MRNDFEFDKVVLAVALSLFCLILSNAIGNMLYGSSSSPLVSGYTVDLQETESVESTAMQSLPDVLDMRSIMLQADASLGAKVFKKCAVCHTAEKHGTNKIGPNLWNIANAMVANKVDFAYSSAMLSKNKESFRWSYENLYRYLFAPKKFIPGTKMAFAGIKKDTERANLLAYLRILSDSPQPLP